NDLKNNDLKKISGETNISNGDMKNYTNIVLFGVDSTEGNLGEKTRTDSIIIMSINKKDGQIKLVSVYRDTYLNVGNDQYTKCNAAYAYGGAEQAINMLNANLDMNISDYVTIGFGGLADIIDDIGGISINVEEDEIQHLNNYQSTMAQELGVSYTPVTQTGEQILNGLQATAYCRIRYTAGNDFKRALRQRTVLTETISGIRKAPVTAILNVAQDMTKWTHTSFGMTELVSLMTGFGKYKMSDTSGFPFADAIATANLGKSKGDCVIPVTLAGNVKELHAFLFGDTDYQVSDTVQTYSGQIASDVKPYLK
ncbi:MAG: LCP family protein, partial [Butyrivibrio sp.]|nr:LCP family protein [Butyrivibrio sp.]